MKLKYLLFILPLVAMTNLYAQESFRDRQIDAKFAAADKNQDGKLMLDQIKAAADR